MADEGLQWMLDIDAKTDGPREMLSVLDRLDATLKKVDSRLEATGKASEQAGEGHKKHGEHAKGMQGALERALHQGLEPFLHKAKEIAEFEFLRETTEKLLELPGELAEKVFELGEEMLKAAAKAERTEKSFSLVFGHRGSEEMLEDIEQIGKNTEFTTERLEQLTGSLGRVGFKGQGLKEARGLALDMASLFDNKDEGLASAQSAIERLMLSGEVSMRTLVGAGISKADFFGELAMRTGKGAKQLEKEMSEGKIKTEVLMEALEGVVSRKTGAPIGGATHEMSHNMDALFDHLGELPERYFKKLSKSHGFEELKDRLGTVFDALDPEGPNGAKIFSALESSFDQLADKIASIDVAGVLEKGIAVIDNMPYAITAVIETVKDLGTFLHPLVTGFETIEHAVEKVMNFVAPKAADQDKLEFRMEHPELFEKSRKLQAELDRKRILEKYGAGDLFVQDPSTIVRARGAAVEKAAASGIKASPSTDVSTAAPMFSPRGASPIARGGHQITVAPQVTVNVNGKADAEAAHAVGRTVVDVTVPAIHGAFDNLAIQTGAAP